MGEIQEFTVYVGIGCNLPQDARCACGHIKGVHHQSRGWVSLPMSCAADGCACAMFEGPGSPAPAPDKEPT